MPCPICDKETAKPFTPFCSKRCADVDLGRWFNGNYAIASEEEPEEAEVEMLIQLAMEKEQQSH
ncbi:MAG: DNA gyrase inhibitor YacG [Rickettsiales bacterium]|nr:DNA gyrase inhibitor YacG [Rickettsiales bacterium]